MAAPMQNIINLCQECGKTFKNRRSLKRHTKGECPITVVVKHLQTIHSLYGTECRALYKNILNVLSKSSVTEGRVKPMDSPITGMWSELQLENKDPMDIFKLHKKFPKGVLAQNCEKELQDLMRQIDRLVAGKKREWEREKDGLQSRLGIREKEGQMQKAALEQKHKEIGQLRQHLDSADKKHHELITQYESQLAQLRAEVQKLQREYERLYKRHVKHKKDSEREKEKSLLDVQDNMQEVQRLTKKVEDYRLRSKDWEIDRRTQQKQIENLESQRKALAEKCEFVQQKFEELDRHRDLLLEKCEIAKQQAQTYQAQLDKRREILDSTEFSLNSQIAQLEAKLSCTAESLKTQNSKVDKLKQSLDDAMNSHKKAMDDNEKLLIDLKKANNQVRKLEELNGELQAELRARDDFLKISEEDSKQNTMNITLLQKQNDDKDDIIKSLSESRDKTEADEMSKLSRKLYESQEQARNSKRSEQVLFAENSQLQDELHSKRDDCDNMSRKLDEKKTDVTRLEAELSEVKSQLSSAQGRLSILDSSHEAELQGMKEQLAKVTTELHDNSSCVETLQEKSDDTEKRLRAELEEHKKKEAELNVANSQIEALRLENRHLRQTIIQQTQINLDHTEKEAQINEIKDSYQKTVKTLEQENTSLREEVTKFQHEIRSMEDEYDNKLSRTLHEAELSYREEMTREQRRVSDVEEDSDRRVSMLQDRLDSTINRYEEQLLLLRRQKARLEDDLDQERTASSSYIHQAEVVYEEDDGVVYVNDDMSLAETSSAEELVYEMPPGAMESASEKFLLEEAARTRQLESIIEGHIESLKSRSDNTLSKQKR